VAFLYVMLLAGTVASSFIFAALLENFSQLRLIQVIQGAAVVTIALNVAALWKQEPRRPSRSAGKERDSDFWRTWRQFIELPRARRTLVAVALGTAAFAMQDILLEPYGGEVLHLSVSKTTSLTGWLAGGTLIGFVLAAHHLSRGFNTYRLASCGVLVGLLAFPCVILSATFGSALLFQAGAALIGLGSGLFSVSTLTAAMAIADTASAGVALGAWGAVQATAAGLAIAASGAIKDIVARLGADGALGPAFIDPVASYNAVYHIEIVLLFATLAAVGPLAGRSLSEPDTRVSGFGLAEFPG
jgi:BCD family chlorophyll transporter-like MFS transporter